MSRDIGLYEKQFSRNGEKERSQKLYNNYFDEIHEEFLQAIREDNLDIIKSIINGKPSIVNEKSVNDSPYLFEVVRFASFEVFLFFIYKNSDVQQTNEYNNTLLHKAAYYNNIKVIKFVLRKQLVDINAQDDMGYSALHHAAYNNNVESVEILLQFNIDKSLKHIYGFTAYDVAFKNGRYQSAELIKNFKYHEKENLGDLIEIELEELLLEDRLKKEEKIDQAEQLAVRMDTRDKELQELRHAKDAEAGLRSQLLESATIILEEQERMHAIKKVLKRIERKEKDLKKSYKKLHKEIHDIESVLESIENKSYQKCELCRRLLSNTNGIFKCFHNHKICHECKENRLLKACPFCEENQRNKGIVNAAMKYILSH